MKKTKESSNNLIINNWRDSYSISGCSQVCKPICGHRTIKLKKSLHYPMTKINTHISHPLENIRRHQFWSKTLKYGPSYMVFTEASSLLIIVSWLDYPVCDSLRLLWAVKFWRFSWELTPLVLLSHLPDNIHHLPWSSFSQSRTPVANCCKAIPAQHPVADAWLWLLLSNVPLRCLVI